MGFYEIQKFTMNLMQSNIRKISQPMKVFQHCITDYAITSILSLYLGAVKQKQPLVYGTLKRSHMTE